MGFVAGFSLFVFNGRVLVGLLGAVPLLVPDI